MPLPKDSIEFSQAAIDSKPTQTATKPTATIGPAPTPVVKEQVNIPASDTTTSQVMKTQTPAFKSDDATWTAGVTSPKGPPLDPNGIAQFWGNFPFGPHYPVGATTAPTAPTAPPTLTTPTLDKRKSGSTTTTGGGGGGGSSHDKWIKSKIDSLMGGQFEWDPSKDEQYKLQSAYLLNQTTQEMVRRGGLYSSVNQMAGQQKLQDLQVSMRAQRYNEWQQERQNTMSLINWIQGQDDRTAAKWAAQQQSKLAAKQSDLQGRMASNEANRALLDKYMMQWKRDGRLSNEAAAFLNTTPGFRPYDSITMDKIKNQLDAEWGKIQSEIVQSNYDEAKLGLALNAKNEMNGGVVPPTAELTNDQLKSYDITQLMTPDQYGQYNTRLTQITSDAGSSKAKVISGLNAWLTEMTKDPAKYRKIYGDAGYKKAMADVSAYRDTISFNPSGYI